MNVKAIDDFKAARALVCKRRWHDSKKEGPLSLRSLACSFSLLLGHLGLSIFTFLSVLIQHGGGGGGGGGCIDGRSHRVKKEEERKG